MRLLLVLLLVVLSISVGFTAQAFPVLDGARQATVVYPAGLEKMDDASNDLVSYLNKATGQEFSAVSEADFRAGPQAYPIYVGRCQLTEELFGDELGVMDQDAFEVLVEPNRVFLVGPTSHATYWAVCDFLERYVGVRWLIPGNLGEDVPSHERITVAPTHRVETPAVLSRQWSGANYGGNWQMRMRMRGRYSFHHNLHKIFDPDKYYDEHPEYYPLRGGKRFRPGKGAHGWHPCFSNPGTVEVAVQAAQEYFDSHPEAISFSFGPADGRGYCTCPDCLKMRGKPLTYHGYSMRQSTVYWPWLGQVADRLSQSHPGKLAGTLAYSNYTAPPPDMDFPPNIIPYICYSLADAVVPRYRDADFDLIRRWGEKLPQIALYDYGYGMGFSIPRIYTHAFQEQIQWALKHNLKGYYAEVYPNWGLDGPKLYLHARVLWDANVNVDRLFDEWNERMFREAAEPMKSYFRRCEEIWANQPDTGGAAFHLWRLVRGEKQFAVFSLEAMDELTGYLDEAARIATADIVKKRIQFFRKTWDVTVFLGKDWWEGEMVRRLIEEDAPVKEVTPWLRAVSNWKSKEEYLKQAQEMIGGDKVAFYPAWDRSNWVVVPGMRKPFQSDVRYWAADKLATAAVQDAQKRKMAKARVIRWAIKRSIANAFGTRGPDAYNAAVDEITARAMTIASATVAPEAPTVDGELSEEVWARAEEISDFTVGARKAAENQTIVKMAHDRQNLYVALECAQDTSQLSGIQVKRDGPVEADDSVSLFLRPTAEDRPCLQVAISPAGGFLDAMFLPEDEQFGQPAEYNYDFEWAVQVQEGRWTAELKVPLKQLGWCPCKYSAFGLNLVRRVKSAGDEESTWFPSFGEEGPEHIRNRGWLVLERSRHVPRG